MTQFLIQIFSFFLMISLTNQLHAQNKEKNTPSQKLLIEAIEKDDIDTLKDSVEKGANIHEELFTHGYRDIPTFVRRQMLPIHFASLRGSLKSITTLIDLGSNVNVQSPNSRGGPLHYAIATNKIDAIQLLITLGADINLKSAEAIHSPITPLYIAAMADSYDSAVLLLTSGAKINPDLATDLLVTAYYSLRFTQQDQTNAVLWTKLFLNHGAKTELSNKYSAEQYTVLTRAIRDVAGKDVLEVIDLLVQAGADVNKHSPLLAALIRSLGSDDPTQTNTPEIIASLLHHGADPNLQDNWDNAGHVMTPLIYAAQSDAHVSSQNLLIEANANINEIIIGENEKKMTALDYAIFFKQKESYFNLLRHGAKTASEIINP